MRHRNGSMSKQLPASAVDKAVAAASILHQIPAREITGKRRFRPVVRARQFAMWLLIQEGYSLNQIAKRFGYHHANVMHAEKVMDALMADRREAA